RGDPGPGHGPVRGANGPEFLSWWRPSSLEDGCRIADRLIKGATMKSDRCRQEGAASAPRGRERGQEMRNRKHRRPGVGPLESRRLLASINDSFTLPPGGGAPQGITAGSDGNLWFTETGSGLAGFVGKINPTTHQVTGPISVGPSPNGITSVPGGAIWFTEAGTPNGNDSAIGRIDPGTRASLGLFVPPTPIPPPTSSVYDLPNGTVSFPESAGAKIGIFTPATITSSQDITEFPLPSGVFGSNPKPSA